MRILLDECVDEALSRSFPGHQCQTCRFAGFKGLTNGELLAAAEQAGFEVLITVERNMPFQQSQHPTISLVILIARTTLFADLTALIPDVLAALEELKPGEVVRVGVKS